MQISYTYTDQVDAISSEAMPLEKNPSGPTRILAKAGNRLDISIDGVKLQGRELVEGKKIFLKRSANHLIVEDTAGEELLEISDFYETPETSLGGDSWAFDQSSDLVIQSDGSVISSQPVALPATVIAETLSATWLVGVPMLVAAGQSIGASKASGPDSAPATTPSTPAVPAITSVNTSWGNGLNLAKAAANGQITVRTSNVEEGQTVSISLNNKIYSAKVTNGQATITVPSADLRSLPDGVVSNAMVTVSNAAGLPAKATAVPAFGVDYSVPLAPGSLQDSTNANGTLTITGKTEPGASVKVVYPDGSVITVTADTVGNFSATSATAQPKGSVSVIATDASNNTGPTATLAYDAAPSSDKTPPTAPSGLSDTTNANGTVTITGKTEPGAIVKVVFPDGSVSTVTADAAGNFSATSTQPVPKGVVSVTATDASNYTSTAATLAYDAARSSDTTPPAAPSGLTDVTNTNGTVTITGKAEPGATVKVVYPDGSVSTATADVAGNFSATSATSQPKGSVSATATDASNYTSPAATLTYNAALSSDKTPPTAPSGLSDTTNANGTVTITGKTEPGASVKVVYPDGSVSTVTADTAGSFSATSATAQPKGSVSATATDASNNTGPAATLAYDAAPSNDLTAPTRPAATYVSNSDGSLTVSGSSEPGATVKVVFPDGTTGTVTASVTGAYTVTSSPAQPGGAIDVVAKDATGNTSPKTLLFAPPQAGSVAEDPLAATTTDTHLAGSVAGANPQTSVSYGIEGVTPVGGVSTLTTAHGTLTVDTVSGAYRYAKNAAAIEAMVSGQSATDTFTLTATPTGGATVALDYAVKITGANDAPTITVGTGDSAASNLTETNAALTATGTLSIADVDTGANATVKVQGVSIGGGAFDATTILKATGTTLAAFKDMLSLTPTAAIPTQPGSPNNLAWNFNSGSEAFNFLAAGEKLTLTYTVAVTDDKNATTTKDVVFNITGTADVSAYTVSLGTGASYDPSSSGYLINQNVGTDPVITVTRSGDYHTSGTGSVRLATQSLTAVGGATNGVGDFTNIDQTLSFASGVNTQTVALHVNGATAFAGSEQLALLLSNPTSGSAGVVSKVATPVTPITILGNATANYGISVDQSQIAEGATPGTLTFTITRNGDTTGTGTVNVGVIGGSAVLGTHYTISGGNNQTLTFTPGQTSKVVTVNVLQDNLATANLALQLGLSAATNTGGTGQAAITVANATATILDDDQSHWTLSTPTTLTNEGEAFTFVVSRTGSSTATTIDLSAIGVTVKGGDLAKTGSFVVNGSSTSGAFGTQTLSFAAGEMSKTITLATQNDGVPSSDRTLVASLGNAGNGIIDKGSLTYTLSDTNVSCWSVAAPTPTVSENAGSVVFTISRTGSLAAGSVNFSTQADTANPNNFQAIANQVVNFAEGETSKNISVAIFNNKTPDSTVDFRGVITVPSSGGITQANSATVTITDVTTGAPPEYTLSAPATVVESDGFLVYTIRRTGLLINDSVDLLLRPGTAIKSSDNGATGDYVFPGNGTKHTVVFAAGETEKTVSVPIVNDGVAEPNKTISAMLSKNDTVGQSTLLLDDDTMNWSVTADSPIVSEAGGYAMFTITRTGKTDATSIDFSTAGATVGDVIYNGGYIPYSTPATPGDDFAAYKNQAISFAAGQMSKQVMVAITPDGKAEGIEGMSGQISKPGVGSIKVATATVQINDNDSMYWSVKAAASTVREDAGMAYFNVSRTDSATQQSVRLTTSSLKAAQGVDYTPRTLLDQEIVFAAGESNKMVGVPLLTDGKVDGDKSIVVSLSSPSVGQVDMNQPSAWSTITDVDSGMAWSIAGTQATGGVSTSAVYHVSDGQAYFVVSRTGLLAAANVTVYVAGGTATPGVDYRLGSPDTTGGTTKTLGFAAGETEKLVQVDLLPGSKMQSTVYGINLGLKDPSAGQIHIDTASVNVTDYDTYQWSISGLQGESASKTSGFTLFTVSRNRADTADSIDVSTAGQQNVAGTNYTGGVTKLTFAIGETTKTVSIPLKASTEYAYQGNIFGVLSNATQGEIAESSAAIRVLDDAITRYALWPQPMSPAGSPEVGTSDNAAGVLNFMVQRTGIVAEAGEVWFVLNQHNGGAIPGVDYEPVVQLVKFAAGETVKTVSVPVLADTLAEANEYMSPRLVAVKTTDLAMGGYSPLISSAGHLDSAPCIFTAGAVVTTVSEAQPVMLFKVMRSGDTSLGATLTYSLAGTAVAGTNYIAPSDTTVKFLAGESVKYVPISLINNTAAATSPTLSLTLTNTNVGELSATASQLSSTVTIGDAASTHAVGATAYALSKSGGDPNETDGYAVFVVTRSGDLSVASSTTLKVGTGGTAIVDVDYTDKLGSGYAVNFAIGEKTKTIGIPILKDGVADGNKTLVVTETVSGTSFRFTIADSDAAGAAVAPTTGYTMSTTVGNAQLHETSGKAAVIITRGTEDAKSIATTYLWTTDGTAKATDSDFTGISGQKLDWAVNETRKVVTVDLLLDNLNEGTEAFSLRLTSDKAGLVPTKTMGNTPVDTTFGLTILDSSPYTGTSANDAYTYVGGFAVNTLDGDDIVTIAGTAVNNSTSVNLGAGQDILLAVSAASTAVAGANFEGGAGTDRLKIAQNISGANTVSNALINLSAANTSTGTLYTGFEVLDLSNPDTTQSVSLRLFDVYAMTKGNVVPYTLRVTGLGAGAVFQLLDAGIAYNSPAVDANITYQADDGSTQTATVVAGTDGRVGFNEVVIGGARYDVMQAAYQGQTLTMLVDTQVSTVFAADTQLPWYGNSGGSAYTYGSTSTATVVDMMDGTDTVTLSNSVSAATRIDLGRGGDVIISEVSANLLVAGAKYHGGAGVDSVRLTGANTANAMTTVTYDFANFTTSGFTGFEGLDMTTGSTVQSASLKLQNVTDLTRHATQPRTFRVTADGNGMDVLQLFTESTSLSTPSVAPSSTITDIDGISSALVTTDSAGLAGFNEVSFGGVKYDVVQYTKDGSVYNLLLSTNLNVVTTDTGTALSSVYVGGVGNDTFTTTVTNAGGITSTGAGVDNVTLGVASTANTEVLLGVGNDTLITATSANLAVAGAHYEGGTGHDMISLTGISADGTLNLTGLTDTDMFNGFEAINMLASGNQVLDLSLADVLDLTGGNTLGGIKTLKIMGAVGDVLNLSELGAHGTLTSPVTGASTISAYNGSTGAVVSNITISADSNANGRTEWNVTEGTAQVYDIYQYTYESQSLMLLVNKAVTTNLIA